MDTPPEDPIRRQPGAFAWLLNGGSLLPSFTSFPLPPPLFGRPDAWTDAGADSGAPPARARPVLTPLELVIHDEDLGWVTLAYSPGVDMTQPIALVLDDQDLGPVTIGWITPADLAEPHATTIRLTRETRALPGHQSLHRPEEEEQAVVKAGYDATEGADEEIRTEATRSDLAPTLAFFEQPLPRFAPVVPAPPLTPGQPFVPPISSGSSPMPRAPRGEAITRQESVQGHPDLYGSVTRFSSDHTGEVTLRLRGVNGIWGADIGTYEMDADGNFRDGGQGAVLGTVRPDGIHLTQDGETRLVPDLTGRTPPAATGSPPGETPLRRGFVHDLPRNREEEDIVNEMTSLGATGEQIQEALERYRRNNGNQGTTAGDKDPQYRRGSKKPRKRISDPTLTAASQKLISELLKHPESLSGKSPEEIAKMFEDVGLTVKVRHSNRGSKRAVFVDISGGVAGTSAITAVEVHPGGGRHRGSYYAISTSRSIGQKSGTIRIVDPGTYIGSTERDTVIEVPGLIVPQFLPTK